MGSGCTKLGEDGTLSTARCDVLVTVRPDADGKGYRLVLNDSTVLVPALKQTPPYGERVVRAYGIVHLLSGKVGDLVKGGEHEVIVVSLSEILTKGILSANAVSELFPEGLSDRTFDPLVIHDTWDTVLEDGFLTLHFSTLFDNTTIHSIDLAPTDIPGRVRLIHQANGDKSTAMGSGTVAFELTGVPQPQTGPDGYRVLTVVYDSFSGPAQIEFRYKPRS